MKKIKLYALRGLTRDYSSFYQTNYKNLDESILRKVIEDQNWQEFDLNNFNIPEFSLCSSDSGKKNYQFDISSSSCPFFIFSEAAVEKLSHILKPRGQFLPIITSSKRKKYIGYYPTNPLVNMIDIEKSGMDDEYLETFGIKEINKLHLKEDAALDDYIICFSEDRAKVFVTEKFRNEVEKAGLKGFDFIYTGVEITVL